MPYEEFGPTVAQITMDGIFLPERSDAVSRDPQEQADVIASREGAAGVYRVALPIIFGIIIALGLVGNILVIYVISSRRKLRTVTNLLLMNLAIADILFLTICGPVTAAHYAMSVWTLGDHVCRLVQYFLFVTCYVTVYTLVVIAAVRYMLVVRGGSPACITNTTSIAYVILGVWGVSLLVNIPVPLSFGTNDNNVTNVTECIISCEIQGQQRFFSLFFGFAYALPLLVISSFYFLLVRHLVAEQKCSMIRKSGQETGNDKRSKRKSSHVTRVLIVVVAMFALCWLPLHVHLMWGSFGQVHYTFTYRMCLIAWYSLVFLNSALNPVIYNFASSEFRDAFRGICKPHLQKEGSTSSGSGTRGALLKSQTTSSK